MATTAEPGLLDDSACGDATSAAQQASEMPATRGELRALLQVPTLLLVAEGATSPADLPTTILHLGGGAQPTRRRSASLAISGGRSSGSESETAGDSACGSEGAGGCAGSASGRVGRPKGGGTQGDAAQKRRRRLDKKKDRRRKQHTLEWRLWEWASDGGGASDASRASQQRRAVVGVRLSLRQKARAAAVALRTRMEEVRVLAAGASCSSCVCVDGRHFNECSAEWGDHRATCVRAFGGDLACRLTVISVRRWRAACITVLHLRLSPPPRRPLAQYFPEGLPGSNGVPDSPCSGVSPSLPARAPCLDELLFYRAQLQLLLGVDCPATFRDFDHGPLQCFSLVWRPYYMGSHALMAEYCLRRGWREEEEGEA